MPRRRSRWGISLRFVCRGRALDRDHPSYDSIGSAMKARKFPTAFTVLAAVLLLVWIASFFIPAGRYRADPETGAPVPGTYHELQSCSPVEAGGTALVVPSPGETGTAPAD